MRQPAASPPADRHVIAFRAHDRLRFVRPLVATLIGVVATWSFGVGRAEEPARKFLKELRERGYHDMAMEYLDRIEKKPSAPADLKEILALERSMTLIEASRVERDAGVREEQLNRARGYLEQFIQANASHPRVEEARTQLGNVLVEQARSKVETAKKGNGAALLKEARQLYEQAYKLFDDSVNQLRAGLKALPANIDPDEKETIEQRDNMRRDYLQSQLLRAVIREESADTVAEGSQTYRQLLEDASKQFEDINSKYRTRLAGLYAKMYHGRVRQKLEEHEEALALFGELIDQPDDPQPFRILKTKTMLLSIVSWLHPSQKKYAEAIETVAPWLEKARPNEQQDADWLRLNLDLARVNLLYGQAQKEADSDEPSPSGLFRAARKRATEVARVSGDLRREALQLLAQLPGADEADADEEQPENFEDAKAAGREALEKMQTAKFSIDALPKRIAAEKDAAVKQELQAQLEEANKAVPLMRDKAIRDFRLALKLAEHDTPTEDLNAVRYYLCYLYYMREDYYDAAVVGEFIARRHPESPGARPSAKIAMAAYLKLYAENEDEDKPFESRRIIQVADFIADRWPDQPEAEEALSTLILFMIKEGQLDEAVSYLEGIPADSPRRGLGELKTGQAMWSQYLTGLRELRTWEREGIPADVDVEAKRKELDALKQKAEQVLTDGVSRMRGSGIVDETMLLAILSLAQIHVDTGQAAKAVALLEDPKMGPLTLVDAKHEAAGREGFAERTYNAALLAYIGLLGETSGNRADEAIQSFDRVMRAADQDPTFLIGLASDIKDKLEVATPDERASLANGLGRVLERVRSKSDDFRQLTWVADTFHHLAGGDDESSAAAVPDAKRYFRESVATYEKMLKGTVPDEYRLQTEFRMAKTLRRIEEYEQALEILFGILKDRTMMLEVQQEAARTFHRWGVSKQDPEALRAAIVGTGTALEFDRWRNPPSTFQAKGEAARRLRNGVIWGWNNLGKLTAGKEKFAPVFYEARYELANSRYQMALAQEEKDKQESHKTMLQAKRDIVFTEQLYSLGAESSGAETEAEFDALLKEIQKKLREPAEGLQAIREKAAKAGDSAG